MIIMKVEFHFGLSTVLINYTDFFVWFSRYLFLFWKLIERWSHDFVHVWIAQYVYLFYVMKSYTFSLWDSACASFLSPLIKKVYCLFYFYLPFLICVLRSLLYFHSYNKYSLVKPVDTLTGKVCEKVCVLFVCLFFGIIYLK